MILRETDHNLEILKFDRFSWNSSYDHNFI